LGNSTIRDDRIFFEPGSVNFYDSGFTLGRRFFDRGWMPLRVPQVEGVPLRILTFVDDAVGVGH
jgi:hypothetical protein